MLEKRTLFTLWSILFSWDMATFTSPLRQESLVRQAPLLGKERGLAKTLEPFYSLASLSLRRRGNEGEVICRLTQHTLILEHFDE